MTINGYLEIFYSDNDNNFRYMPSRTIYIVYYYDYSLDELWLLFWIDYDIKLHLVLICFVIISLFDILLKLSSWFNRLHD